MRDEPTVGSWKKKILRAVGIWTMICANDQTIISFIGCQPKLLVMSRVSRVVVSLRSCLADPREIQENGRRRHGVSATYMRCVGSVAVTVVPLLALQKPKPSVVNGLFQSVRAPHPISDKGLATNNNTAKVRSCRTLLSSQRFLRERLKKES